MKRSRDVVMLTAGVLILLIALAADRLGLGSHPGLGAWQLLAAAGGVIVAAAGMFEIRRGRGR